MTFMYTFGDSLHVLPDALRQFNKAKGYEGDEEKMFSEYSIASSTSDREICLVEIIIKAKDLIEGSNNLSKRLIWGTHIYTHDSDIGKPT